MRTETSNMKPNEPGRTALMIARQRAAHQVLDHGSILDDPFAMKILREDEKDVLQFANEHPLARHRTTAWHIFGISTASMSGVIFSKASRTATSSCATTSNRAGSALNWLASRVPGSNSRKMGNGSLMFPFPKERFSERRPMVASASSSLGLLYTWLCLIGLPTESRSPLWQQSRKSRTGFTLYPPMGARPGR